jgi:hypothetical protein
MADAGRSRTQWLKRPLCRRYVLTFFDVAVARLREGEGLRDLPVHWAFGWLIDGEGEALGAWMDSGDGSVDPVRLLADIQARGVERTGYLAGTGTCSGIDEARVSRSVQLEAEQVSARLNRAIRRHGSFETGAAVLDFMVDALQRAERRLDRERLVVKGRARLDSGVQMAPVGL